MAHLRASSQDRFNPVFYLSIYLSIYLTDPTKLRLFLGSIAQAFKNLIIRRSTTKSLFNSLFHQGERLLRSLFLSPLPLREEGIKGRGIFIPRLLFLLLLVVVFPTLAIEAKTIPDGEVTKPLNVEFKQGLFSIDAKEITLGEILAEIEKQSGFTISIDESLKRSPVTVSLSDLDIIKAIHLITSAAGLGGYGISYRSANSPGETGEYIVEMVALLNNGDDVEISIHLKKGLSSNEWIKSLKQSTPSERTRYDKESVK